jgi:hypothetical protein
MLEVIDYREYIVSLSTLCMRADPQTRIAFVFNLFDEVDILIFCWRIYSYARCPQKV